MFHCIRLSTKIGVGDFERGVGGTGLISRPTDSIVGLCIVEYHRKDAGLSLPMGNRTTK